MGHYIETEDKILKEILTRLNDEFHPKKVFLFGSRVNSSPTKESDYDLFLVVEKSNLRTIQRAQKAQRLLWDIKASVDVFVYTETEFEGWKNELNSIAHTASHDGVELKFG